MKLNEKIAVAISTAALATAAWAIPAYADPGGTPSPNGHCPDGYFKLGESYDGGSTWEADAAYAAVILVAGKPGPDRNYTIYDVVLGQLLERLDEKDISHICLMLPEPSSSESPSTTPTTTTTPSETPSPSVTPTGSPEPTETSSPSPSPTYITPSIQRTTITPTPTGSAEPTGSTSPTPTTSSSPSPSDTTDTKVLSAGPATAVSGTPSYTG